MAMRHRYGYNGQVVNFANIQELTPLGYIETVPGETFQGTVSIKARSQPLLNEPDTRVFFDCFAFYVPFRLLWDQWPDFISREQSVAEVAAPRITTLFPFNFENRFTLATTTTFDGLPVWTRYAYNKIWNQFFRREDVAERALGDNTAAIVPNRASTMETRTTAYNAGSLSIAGATTVDELRRVFARDVYAKMRNFYGSKYVDYLAALGVKTDWAVLEEPEMIGQYHGDWPFKTTNTTFGDSTSVSGPAGSPKGQFLAKAKLRLRRTFSPEHGLIAIYGCARADGWYGVGPQPVVNGKINREQFWNPEYETLDVAQYPGPVFSAYAATGDSGADQWKFLKYEEYRTGQNYGRPTVTTALPFVLSATTANTSNSKYVQPVSADYNANFSIGTQQHYQAVAEYRLARFSPVRRELPKLKVT